MIPDAAGLKSLRGVVLQFFHKFLSIYNPQGGFRCSILRASIGSYKHKFPKFPPLFSQPDGVQEDSI